MNPQRMFIRFKNIRKQRNTIDNAHNPTTTFQSFVHENTEMNMWCVYVRCEV